MSALLDTGFLLAVLDADDTLHERCVQALLKEPEPRLPSIVLPELAYMVLRELGHAVLARFLESLEREEMPIEWMRGADIRRTREILLQYEDNRVDFVDCAIVAMAERLDIYRILTVDQRHFRIIRPRHVGFFTISP